MANRIHNFNAGPAALPLPVLEGQPGVSLVIYLPGTTGSSIGILQDEVTDSQDLGIFGPTLDAQEVGPEDGCGIQSQGKEEPHTQESDPVLQASSFVLQDLLAISDSLLLELPHPLGVGAVGLCLSHA